MTELEAVLELLGGQMEIYLTDSENSGPIARRTPGTMDFTANGAGLVNRMVLEFRGKPIWHHDIDNLSHVATGDTIHLDVNDGENGLASMIYDLIDRGAFLNAVE